jgi:putative sterol carrier protein
VSSPTKLAARIQGDATIMTVRETFESMLANFNPANSTGVNKTLQWNIAGDELEKWAFHVHDQTCELISGGAEKADIVFQASEKDWLSLNSGKLDATMAFMTGKIKITGDMGLAMKVSSLFPTPVAHK